MKFLDVFGIVVSYERTVLGSMAHVKFLERFGFFGGRSPTAVT